MHETITKARRGWILAGLMATMMLAAMDTTIVATAVPQIVGDLGGFSLFTWVFSIYLLTQTVTIPIYGKFADIYGRKPVLIVGAIIFLLGSAACAASWDMLSLIVFRGLQGLGAGSIMATVNTLAADLYTLKERGKVQGWLSSMWGVSAIAGPTLGGTFAQYLSWHWIFLVNIPAGAIAIAIIGLLFQERVQSEKHKIDMAGAGFVFVSVGLFIFGLLQGGVSWPWWSWPSVGIFVAAFILIIVTVVLEGRACEPIMPGWLWKHRALVCSNLAMIGMGTILMGPDAFLSTYGQAALGLGAVAAGLVLATMSFGWPTASALSAHLYLTIGFRNTGLIGASLLVLGSASFVMLNQPAPVWLVIFIQIMLGAGFGLVSTSMLVGAQNTVDWGQRGVVTGGNIFSRFLGQSIGAALFGAVFNHAIMDRLAQAPKHFQNQLPDDMNRVVDTLNNPNLQAQAVDYLRQSVAIATQHIYLGMTVIALITWLSIWFMPKVMPSVNKRG